MSVGESQVSADSTRFQGAPPASGPSRERLDRSAPTHDPFDELRALVKWMDDDLDGAVAAMYRNQPLAQDWARVSKVAEEVGEAIDALIGITGQNPRKGHYGSGADLQAELCDVALTGLYALQHFTKDSYETMGLLMDRARHHHNRRAAQIDGLDR